MAGRAGKLLGKGGAAIEMRGKNRKHDRKGEHGETKAAGSGGGIKGPEHFVFEGKRASEKDGNVLKKKNKKSGRKIAGRGARRAAEWKKQR